MAKQSKEEKAAIDSSIVKLVTSDGTVLKEGQLEYVVGSNGIFKKVENAVVHGYIKVEEIPFMSPVVDKLQLKIPAKIPLNLYAKIYKRFSEVTTEVLVLVFWDDTAKKYFVYEPKQRVSGASVNWKDRKVVELELKYKLIAEFHSHVKMGTFFSGVDDEDENRGLIYGVIATTGAFECDLRIKFGEKEYEVAFEDVVDSPEVDWKRNIVTDPPVTTHYIGGAGYQQTMPAVNFVNVVGYGYFPRYMTDWQGGQTVVKKEYDTEDNRAKYSYRNNNYQYPQGGD